MKFEILLGTIAILIFGAVGISSSSYSKNSSLNNKEIHAHTHSSTIKKPPKIEPLKITLRQEVVGT